MKRFLALAALVLGLASCQTEPEGLNVNVGGEVDTVVTVTIPETETRYGDESNSALSIFDNGVLGNENDDKTMRYILEIYYKNELFAERLVDYSDGKTVTFPVRLVAGRKYNFVVWADYVESENDTDFHYNTKNEDADYYYGLTNVTLKDTWVAMDETRDAFTGFLVVDSYSGSKSINIPLTRPFAKLRVITTDMVELGNLGIMPTSAKVTYSAFSHKSFNALNGTYSNAEIETKTHKYAIADYADFANTAEEASHKVLFTDYFFADASDVVKFELDVYEVAVTAQNDNVNRIKHIDFKTDIPAQRNYLTTIQGNILTEGNDINVTVENDGAFYQPENIVEYVEVKSATELQEAIDESDENTVIVLGNDIVLGATTSTLSTRSANNNSLTVAVGTTSTIDLNGKTIRTQWSDEALTKHYYAIYNYGNLTIKDSGANGAINGAIVSRGIYNYGTLTLESGKIDACDGNGGYAVYNQNGSTFVMNGGMITTSLEDDHQVDNGGYDATTLRLEPGATAIINGGTIDNICDYTFAIDNYGEVTVNGGTFTSIHSTVSTYGTMTIKGGSFTCNGLEGITAHALVAWDGSETTINGGTFDGKDNYNGFNVDANEGAIVNINGGKFLSVHSGSLYGKGTINVKGGTFFDDPSARVVKGYVAEKNGDVFVVSKIALEENFADNSWDKIILACQNNIVPKSWNVGDKKAMTINGKDYQIRIIGKNHDTYTAGGTAPLTFQIAETYGTAPMNATQTNTTGWSGSLMRTETMPAILAAMPVKDAIKAVDKETLNGTRDGLETTSDKLFLLSEIEVNGSDFFSNGFAEGSHYAIYSDADSQKMNASYWLRGPGKNNAIGFTQINNSGYMANGSAEYACGVVFGFCF